jgi:hypothetical protein
MQRLAFVLRRLLQLLSSLLVGFTVNDSEKMQRWAETIAWADTNGCRQIVDEIPEQDFYFVEDPI